MTNTELSTGCLISLKSHQYAINSVLVQLLCSSPRPQSSTQITNDKAPIWTLVEQWYANYHTSRISAPGEHTLFLAQQQQFMLQNTWTAQGSNIFAAVAHLIHHSNHFHNLMVTSLAFLHRILASNNNKKTKNRNKTKTLLHVVKK